MQKQKILNCINRGTPNPFGTNRLVRARAKISAEAQKQTEAQNKPSKDAPDDTMAKVKISCKTKWIQ